MNLLFSLACFFSLTAPLLFFPAFLLLFLPFPFCFQNTLLLLIEICQRLHGVLNVHTCLIGIQHVGLKLRIHAFDDMVEIDWKQGRGIIAGDTIFLYAAAPVLDNADAWYDSRTQRRRLFFLYVLSVIKSDYLFVAAEFFYEFHRYVFNVFARGEYLFARFRIVSSTR